MKSGPFLFLSRRGIQKYNKNLNMRLEKNRMGYPLIILIQRMNAERMQDLAFFFALSEEAKNKLTFNVNSL